MKSRVIFNSLKEIMNKKLSTIYNSPHIETIELVLEKGIAFTVTKDGSQIDTVEEGDGWDNF